MKKSEEVDIIVDRAKIVSLLTALQKKKLTLGQSFELERLLVKERDIAIQSRVTDLDIIIGYYLIGLNGYMEGCYYDLDIIIGYYLIGLNGYCVVVPDEIS